MNSPSQNHLTGGSTHLPNESDAASAESLLQESLSSIPNHAQAHFTLATMLSEQGRPEAAVAGFREAIRLAPAHAEAHLGLANALALTEKKPESIRHYRRALELRPNWADALNGLGLTLIQLKRWDEGVVYLRHAVRLKPDFAEAFNSLGLAYNERTEWSKAEAAFEEALRLKPRYVEAHANFASCYAYQGRQLEALAAYDIALWLKPDNVLTRWNRSLSLLQLGNYEEGWKEYELRWKRKRSPMRSLPRPMWDGSSLEGKRILLWCEQGLGDTVQFCRYIQLVKQKGASIAFECPAPLVKLLARFPGVDQLVPEGQPLPAFDCHAPLMSLPRLFGTTLATVPANIPYLSAQSERISRWQDKLKDEPGYKIGLAWQGNPHHQWDRHRSLPLAALSPLSDLPNIRLYSLQRGPGAEQVGSAKEQISVANYLDPTLSDAESWAQVAALMMNMDLIVTVDTAAAHVAGALGVETFLLLSDLCDWRWLRDRQDSPWYPTVTLFRQKKLGGWQEVTARLRATVAARLRR